MNAAGSACIDRSRQRQQPVPRRALLMAGCAGVVGCAVPRIAHAATPIVMPEAAGDRRLSVLYRDDRIGTHTVPYSSATSETRVDTEIHLLVKVAFLTVFAFSHLSRGTWRAGQLLSLNSETVEDGVTLHVDGAATPHGFRVVSEGGPFIADAATLTSNSLWTRAVLEQATWSTRSMVASSGSARAGMRTSRSCSPAARFVSRAIRSSRPISPAASGTMTKMDERIGAVTAAHPIDLETPVLAQSVFWVDPINGGIKRH